MAKRKINRKGNVHFRDGRIVVIKSHPANVSTGRTFEKRQRNTSPGPTKKDLADIKCFSGGEFFSSTADIENFANKILLSYGLKELGWKFQWSSSKVEFGKCNFVQKTITVSRALAEVNNDEEIKDTVLHEVAHALAGPAAKHGEEWKKVAEMVGARPEAKAPEETKSAVAKWIGTCPNCGDTVSRHRLTESTRKTACADCCNRYNNGKFTREYCWDWKETNLGE